MRITASLFSSILLGLIACGGPAAAPTTGGDTSPPATAVDPAPRPAAAPAMTATEMLDGATVLAAILNDEARAADLVERSAPVLSVTMISACGEDARKQEVTSLRRDEDKRIWHASNMASWGPACQSEAPPPSCQWMNPLSFDPARAVCSGACCALKDGPGLHATAFLTRACFDREGRVEAIVIEDGC